MVLAHKDRTKTYADYLAVPDGERAELVDGELLMSPQPKGRHIRVASILGADLNVAFGRSGPPTGERPGGWWIFDEPECHLLLDKRVLIPDLAGWRRARLPTPPADTHKFTVAPDWVCEVLSPSTSSRDYLVKMPVYREAGVRWVWIIDPAHGRVEVFQAGDGEWVLEQGVEGAGPFRLQPFDGVALDPTDWWF